MNILPDLALLLQHSLLYGIILAFAACALFLIGAYLNPAVMLQGYPPDIQARYGAGRTATKWQRIGLAIPVGIVLFGTLIAALAHLPPTNSGEMSWLAAALCVLVMLFTLNVVDLLLLDWLIFNTIQPRFIVLPGTAGMASYRDYGFHFKQFLKGTLGSLVASPIIASIAVVVYYL